MSYENDLAHKLRQHNFILHREEPFTLASGKKSHWYCDIKAAMLFGPTADAIARRMAEMFLRTNSDTIASVETGGLPLVATMAKALSYVGHKTQGFVMRKVPKGHGVGGMFVGSPPMEPHARVFVVEDVITTGGSVMQLIRWLREQNLVISQVTPVVDRSDQDGPLVKGFPADLLRPLLKLSDLR